MSEVPELCIYHNGIKAFISAGKSVYADLVSNGKIYIPNFEQICAWEEEIVCLQKTLLDCGAEGQIIFEYNMARLGDRIDVVLLLSSVVFSLEFKTGEQKPNPVSRKQANRYASDLRNFHEASKNLYICPILVVPEDASLDEWVDSETPSGGVFPLQTANNKSLPHALERIQERKPQNITVDEAFAKEWINSPYKPSPDIIEAVGFLKRNKAISDKAFRTDSTSRSIVDCSATIDEIIRDVQKTPGKKAIIFVAGVPGAGKTVVGINTVFSHFSDKIRTAFVSGNGPLIQVLKSSLLDQASEALKNERYYELKDQYRNKSESELRVLMETDETLKERIAKETRAIKWQMLEFKGYKEDVYKRSKYIDDNILVFDEAQRAWTSKQMQKKGLKRSQEGKAIDPKGVIVELPKETDSEPSFLMQAMEMSPDWRVIVALVGLGQHINSGETGVNEWLSVLGPKYSNWDVYLPDQLLNQTVDPVSEDNKIRLASLGDHFKHGPKYSGLYMSESLRNVRGSCLSEFVDGIIDGDSNAAKKNLAVLKEGGYPIFITRDLKAAKHYIKYVCCSGEGDRCGIIASSNALRLKVDGLLVNDRDFNTIDWFLAEPSSFKSSNFMEKPASEFDIEGLEIDWSVLGWDLDMRREENGWGQYSIAYKNDWVKQYGLKAEYIRNSYRVLLTRSRKGFVIFVPDTKADLDPTTKRDMDFTRPSKEYDKIYEFLHEDCGIQDLPK